MPSEAISILYIEDDLGFARLMKKRLERHGFELKHEKETHQWGPVVIEQYYERINNWVISNLNFTIH